MDFLHDALYNGWMHGRMSVGQARDIAEGYRFYYNNERPHSSLGDSTPVEFMRLEEEKAVGIL